MAHTHLWGWFLEFKISFNTSILTSDDTEKVIWNVVHNYKLSWSYSNQSAKGKYVQGEQGSCKCFSSKQILKISPYWIKCTM